MAYQQRRQQPHRHPDQPVQYLPGARPGKPGRQPARAKAQQGEPGHAGRTGPGDKPALQRAGLLRTDAAHQQHRVEVDMRIEQRERSCLGDRGAPGQSVAGLPRVQMTGLAQPQPGFPAIPGQEHRTCQRQGLGQLGSIGQGLGHAKDPGHDQQRIGGGTEQHHAADMFTPQALSQHKSVLRTDGHDQPETQQQALRKDRPCRCREMENGTHAPILLALPNESKLHLLHLD